eukprot:gene1401-1017_t
MPLDEIRDTSIDMLMSSYGEAEGGPTCGADFGNQLIKRWRDTREVNCAPSGNSDNKLNSKIDCFLMHQNHHHGNGDNLCLMENVAMDLGVYGHDQFTRSIIDHYVQTRHADQPYPKFPSGFITGDCDVQPEHWQSRVMPGWNADLTTGAYRHIRELKNADQVQCDTWIEHPVLMQERDTFANFFHDSEDFVNKTALVRSYSDFVIRTLGLQNVTHYASSKPKREVVITYMSRRPSKEWPEKKYCDDEKSFFRCALWQNFGPRSLGRMIRNDQDVINALHRLESESFANGATVKITAVDFNVLSFKEQIAVDLQTDIMVGPHGAGLMHNIFMRDRASLIELFIDGSGANRHFHNLAGWYGRKYEGVSMSNPVNIEELLRIVRRHISSIDLNAY